MAEVNVDRNLYLNPNRTWTDENGVEHYGVMEEGWRDPDDHTIHFDEPAPEATPDATEAATRKADELGVDLTTVAGTGTDGRITVDDVEKAAG